MINGAQNRYGTVFCVIIFFLFIHASDYKIRVLALFNPLGKYPDSSKSPENILHFTVHF